MNCSFEKELKNSFVDLTEDQNRYTLIKYVQDVVFKKGILETYWSDVFKTRDRGEDLKFTEISPFVDIFKQGFRDATESELIWICHIARIRYHWDLIMALYVIFCPSIFNNTSSVARMILDRIGVLKLGPNMFTDNFDSGVHDFLFKYVRGEKLDEGNYNHFLRDPAYVVFNILRAMVLMGAGETGMETDKEIEEKGLFTENKRIDAPEDEEPTKVPLLPQLKKMQQGIYSEFYNYFPKLDPQLD